MPPPKEKSGAISDPARSADHHVPMHWSIGLPTNRVSPTKAETGSRAGFAMLVEAVSDTSVESHAFPDQCTDVHRAGPGVAIVADIAGEVELLVRKEGHAAHRNRHGSAACRPVV